MAFGRGTGLITKNDVVGVIIVVGLANPRIQRECTSRLLRERSSNDLSSSVILVRSYDQLLSFLPRPLTGIHDPRDTDESFLARGRAASVVQENRRH